MAKQMRLEDANRILRHITDPLMFTEAEKEKALLRYKGVSSLDLLHKLKKDELYILCDYLIQNYVR